MLGSSLAPTETAFTIHGSVMAKMIVAIGRTNSTVVSVI